MSVDGLLFRSRVEGTVAGVAIALASGDPVPGMPLSQSLGVQSALVTAGSTVTLWAASSSPLTGFDYLAVMAGDPPSVDALDGDGTTPSLAGQVELTCNNGDAAEQIWIEQLRAFLPYQRFSDVGRFNISAGGNGFSGTADVVDQVRYKNDTSDDLTVRWIVAKA